ncbi:Endonuclease III [Olavius algarvensis spirochete endosymbiont]|uniref:endonuclease III domain-containing protein n=1 Tax=Olavius algarvensis spirochete endosymbiont TaxID=260710 RepID=UPI000F1A18FB|nr:endonuclease III [Olavius algarvensis spirochete endosymbiont]CAD7837219.1 MAG: Endonuclease III (EC 4.2.99.18) [Olavius algarvensis spirochete endosymbiont]VDB00749.1 Endonuclease III [Olavius algarvensis spirochete endosymbiont]
MMGCVAVRLAEAVKTKFVMDASGPYILELHLNELIRRLNSEYPNWRPPLNYRNPYELFVAVSLSAQTTDVAVNRVTPSLFRLYPSSRELASADIRELEKIIHPLGFFRQKAGNLVRGAKRMVKEYGGELPQEMDRLTSLSGIGRKSANVIRSHIWGLPGIIVDTHFGRVCRRLGLTEEKNPVKIEREIGAIVPEKCHIDFSMTVNFHGRKYCMSRRPNCYACPLSDICPRHGL